MDDNSNRKEKQYAVDSIHVLADLGYILNPSVHIKNLYDSPENWAQWTCLPIWLRNLGKSSLRFMKEIFVKVLSTPIAPSGALINIATTATVRIKFPALTPAAEEQLL